MRGHSGSTDLLQGGRGAQPQPCASSPAGTTQPETRGFVLPHSLQGGRPPEPQPPPHPAVGTDPSWQLGTPGHRHQPRGGDGGAGAHVHPLLAPRRCLGSQAMGPGTVLLPAKPSADAAGRSHLPPVVGLGAWGCPSPPGTGYLATPEPAWPRRGDLFGPLGSQARAAPSPLGTPPWCREEQGGCCSEPNPTSSESSPTPNRSQGALWAESPLPQRSPGGGRAPSRGAEPPFDHFNCVLPTGTSSPAPFHARHTRYPSPKS